MRMSRDSRQNPSVQPLSQKPQRPHGHHSPAAPLRLQFWQTRYRRLQPPPPPLRPSPWPPRLNQLLCRPPYLNQLQWRPRPQLRRQLQENTGQVCFYHSSRRVLFSLEGFLEYDPKSQSVRFPVMRVRQTPSRTA